MQHSRLCLPRRGSSPVTKTAVVARAIDGGPSWATSWRAVLDDGVVGAPDVTGWWAGLPLT